MNILDLPDDELAKLDPSTFGADPGQSTEAEPTEGSVQPEVNKEVQAQAEEPETTGEGEGQGSETEPADEGGEGSGEADAGQAKQAKTEATEPAKAEEAKADPAAEVKPEEKVEPQKGEPDYKAEYEKLLAPFVANGREITVKSVDDAIALMQMGANYNKKMAALKPNLKLMKLLESNGLMSEEKIGFLIDLEKKSPEAISKLIKESGLDPMDLDADKADGYKPTARAVDDRELELDAVLDEIQESPAYQRTITVVSKEWDAESKQVIANAPQLLKVINSHVQSGIYDLISKEIEGERMLGRLRGVSDIEAYRQVGDAIQARGGFAHLSAPGSTQRQQAPAAAPVVVQPKPKQVDEEKLKEKRRAASTAKPAASSAAVASDFNPLALSDEEFSKLIRSNIL